MLSLAFAVMTVACTKDLSKTKAKEILAKRYHEKPTLYCSLKNGVMEEKPGIFSRGINEDKCALQLQQVGALVSVGCVHEYSSGGCMTYGYKTGPKGLVERGHNMQVECGTKKFGDVTSITTEGKKAKVKFTRSFKLDDTKAKLSDCILEPIEDGENEGSTVFVQDDSGNWTEQ